MAVAIGYYSVSQSVRKASRNFRVSIYRRRVPKGIWCFVVCSLGVFRVMCHEGRVPFLCWTLGRFTKKLDTCTLSFMSNLHVIGLVTGTMPTCAEPLVMGVLISRLDLTCTQSFLGLVKFGRCLNILHPPCSTDNGYNYKFLYSKTLLFTIFTFILLCVIL